MDKRILFEKGKQREFLDLVVLNLNCISIRGILQFGFEFSYDCLKNYYSERRLIPLGFFESLCHVAKIDKDKLNFKIIEGNYGQIKGGKKSRR